MISFRLRKWLCQYQARYCPKMNRVKYFYLTIRHVKMSMIDVLVNLINEV